MNRGSFMSGMFDVQLCSKTYSNTNILILSFIFHAVAILVVKFNTISAFRHRTKQELCLLILYIF